LLNYLTLIFVCQLAGELMITALKLPLPGPVVGMIALFAFLVIHGRFAKDRSGLDASGVPVELAKVGKALLDNLSLLFVPAGVGVMAHFALLKTDWLALGTALVISTLLTIVVTAMVMRFMQTRFSSAGKPDGGSNADQ
jgi:putative effector of murein hydrolase LrgA (UPF0299 family)